MRFGIFSNGQRCRKIAADTYDADLAEIVAADQLGFDEAWVSEHMGGWAPDVVPFSELLIAKAAGLTERIRLAPAVRLLPLFHPLNVAVSAAMCDHLLRGRYTFGFGSGVPFLGNMQRRGLANDQRHPMMMEAIDYILKCWTATEPFDWHGKSWPGTAINIDPKPNQAPHPPIAVATGQAAVTAMAAERGWTTVISQFDTADSIRRRADIYVAAAKAAGRGVAADKVTVARHLHVSDTVAQARDEMREGFQTSVEEWKTIAASRFDPYLPPGVPATAFTAQHAFDSGLFIAGDPDTVYRQVKDIYDRSGGFGTMLIVMGKDWGTAVQRDRSLQLFMREVAPRLAALDANALPRAATAPSDASASESQIAAAY
jgi:alkanesulfonate monooxygenase SsuD/methylene tetrahydromethanopterin reductase-like flavin-dependent oxidoreductase (luciferase family)